MAKKKPSDLPSPLEDHWKGLMDLIELVEPPKLRKAMRKWVNDNMNCAYSVKTGSCNMDCETCLNDITLGRML